jgi:hypothetical protein
VDVIIHLVEIVWENVDWIQSGLRDLEVTFPPHDPSDAGSIPAEVVEFFRTEKFWNKVLRKGL